MNTKSEIEAFVANKQDGGHGEPKCGICCMEIKYHGETCVAGGQSEPHKETPRTNALLLKTFKGEIEHDGLAAIVDLARKLERELYEMNHIAVARYHQISRITAMWRKDIEECDKLKEKQKL
jgi:hypothetical protein